VLRADRPRGPDQLAVRRVLHEFLRHFVLIRRVSGFWLEVVYRTVHPGLPDCPRGSDRLRVGYGPSVFRGAEPEVRAVFAHHSS
jgi:hypothetical protein